MTPPYKTGLIAGAFELIHPGYIRVLADAKKICEHLVVALQIDPAVERPKTKWHPVIPVLEREEILLSIRYVDEVQRYETETDLVALLLWRKPDVRIVGSDYIGRTITGLMGIPVYYHHRNHNWSVTMLRRLICESTKEWKR